MSNGIFREVLQLRVRIVENKQSCDSDLVMLDMPIDMKIVGTFQLDGSNLVLDVVRNAADHGGFCEYLEYRISEQ